MKLELTQRLHQQQILAPQMILSMDILLLANAELESRIEKEFSENPALEIVERLGKEKVTAEATGAEAAPADSKLFEKIDGFQSQQGSQYDEARRPRASASANDDRLDILQNTEGKPRGLKDLLTEQIHLMTLSSDVRDVAEEIVNNLDHRGYLHSSVEEIFDSVSGAHTRVEFDAALGVVRSLDPAGVGAENLKECLLLQLERDKQEYQLETEIIRHHLDDLRDNRIPKIAKELNATVEDIKDAIEIITALDPLPGARYESVPTIYVRPDVIVEKNDGQLEVKVDNSSIPNLSISDSCKRLLKESRGNPEVSNFVRKKIESAQWLIQAVRQRQRTLHDIAVTLVDYQRDFMEKGPQSLRAMRMQTIADLVHVHISTISRAIKAKYIQTPWGLYEMRFFFTGGVENGQGEVQSRRNVYRTIAEIIQAEDKKHPLSDSDIATILQQKGLHIARRTVTKYREQGRIPSSRLRKAY